MPVIWQMHCRIFDKLKEPKKIMGLLIVVILALMIASASSSPSSIYGASSLTVPLLGNYNELFFWYTRIAVGGKAFTVTVDTGSSDLLIPALGCQTCIGGNASQYYNVSSKNAVPCGSSPSLKCRCGVVSASLCSYSVTYGGALTLYANAVHDTVSLGGILRGSNVLFGATYNVSQGGGGTKRRVPSRLSRGKRQSMQDYPEGIWGLAFPNINALGTLPLLDSLVVANKWTNLFALCVQPIGGTMQIGGLPPKWGRRGWAFTGVTSKNGFWQPQFLDVAINGKSLGFPSRVYNTPGIIDSGTPFTTIPVGPFAAFKSLLLANCSHNPLVGICGLPENATIFDNGNCFPLSEAQRAAYPVLQFSLHGGVHLALEPHFYLMGSICQTQGQFGLGIVSDPSFTVLGANTLLKYATVFDADNMRAGFSDMGGAKCPSTAM